MAGPDSALGGDSSHTLTAAPATGLVIEGKPPVDANIDIVAVHGLHRAAFDRRWQEGNDENTSIRQTFEKWTGKRVRLMTYIYPPMTLTPRRIHQEASSLLDALQDIRARKDGSTDDSEDTERKKPDRGDPEQGDGDDENLRPIIFISQDVGGLIIKAALTRATSLHRPFSEITASVMGLIFVACPHRHDGPRPLEDQLLDVLQGHVPSHLSVSAQARDLAQTTKEINGEFFRTKSIVSVVLINVFSEAEDPRDRVFDRYTVTTETPFEIPVSSGAANTGLVESLLGGDEHASSVLNDAANTRWNPKPHKPGTISGLQALFSLASPVFPLRDLSDVADAAVAGLQKDLDEFSSTADTRILHLRAKTVSEASLLARSLVRRCNVKNSAPPSPSTRGKIVFNFEFRRGDVRFDNIRSMLATFLAQLFFNEIYSYYTLVESRVNIPAEYRGWSTEDLLTIWRRRRFTKDLDEVVYVFGGLDQCNESVRYFLRWLEFVACQTELPIKVIITSSAELGGQVEEVFDSCPNGVYRVLDLSGEVDPGPGGLSGSGSQLAFLVRQQPRYDGLEPKLALLMANIAENDGILQVVVNWLKHTSLPLDTIEATIDKLDLESLEAVLDVILGLIPADRRVWSRRILSFACAAGRPLGVTELCAVSRLARTLPDDPNKATCDLVFKIPYLKDELKGVFDWLGSLLTIRDGEFHLRNSSLRDALRPQIASHRIRQHKDILDICISYLGRPCGIKVPAEPLDDQPLDDRRRGRTGSGSIDILDPLPYAAGHWSRHYVILHASKEPSYSIAEIRRQVSQLLKEVSFVEHWAATRQAESRPFAPLPEGTFQPGPLSVAAQLGLEDLVHEFLPSPSPERHAGLVAAATNGHLGAVKLLLRPAGEYRRPDCESLVEAAKEAAASGHNDIFDLLVKELYQRPTNKPPPPSLLFRAAFLGLEGVVGTLLDLGVDVSSREETDLKRTALHIAVNLDRVAVLEVLVRRGIQVSAETAKTGYHPVHTASNYGSVECVKALLDADPSESEAETSSNTPLVLAAEEGNFEVAEVLLKHDQHCGRAAEDMAVGYGKALHRAADLGYRRTADLLLRYGADPNRTRFSGWSSLQLAVWKRHLEICRLLLEHKADANEAGDNPAPLLIAAGQGDAAIVALLNAHGASVDAPESQYRQTALHMAAVNGHDEIVRVLLENGASIDTRDKGSYTPLFVAALYGNAGAVEILATAGADVDAKSGWRGWGPLHASHGAPSVVRALLKHGANVNEASEDGSPLRVATHFSNTETARLLLEKGAELELDGEEREPLLAIAVSAGSLEVAGVLLEAGADASQMNGFSHSITKAMEQKGAKMLELLLEFSPNPSLRESNTFLNFIGSDTPVRSVQRLLRAGVDPNREDGDGHAALCAAVKSSNVDVAGYLLGLKSVRRHGIRGHTSTFAGLLHHAVHRSTVEMARLLVEAGEDVNAIGDIYGGIVSAACYHCNDADDTKKIKTLRYLIHDVKADVNARGGVVGYAINMAASSCGPGVVRLLLDEKAEPDVEDSLGRRAVHLACQNDLPVLQALSAPDEAFSRRDRLGRLPLHFAAVSGSVALVREVLERSRRVGVGVDEPDVHGWTALMWAARTCDVQPDKDARPREDDREAVVKLLLDEGADRSVSGKAEGGRWTPAEVAVFHGAGKGLVRLLSTGSDQGGSRNRAKGRVGVSEGGSFCDACLMTICGYYYHRETSEVRDLCFKCYQSREELVGRSEWVKRGEEKEEEGDEDAVVNSPDIDGHGDAGSEEDEGDVEDIIIEEE